MKLPGPVSLSPESTIRLIQHGTRPSLASVNNPNHQEYQLVVQVYWNSVLFWRLVIPNFPPVLAPVQSLSRVQSDSSAVSENLHSIVTCGVAALDLSGAVNTVRSEEMGENKPTFSVSATPL